MNGHVKVVTGRISDLNRGKVDYRGLFMVMMVVDMFHLRPVLSLGDRSKEAGKGRWVDGDPAPAPLLLLPSHLSGGRSC